MAGVSQRPFRPGRPAELPRFGLRLFVFCKESSAMPGNQGPRGLASARASTCARSTKSPTGPNVSVCPRPTCNVRLTRWVPSSALSNGISGGRPERRRTERHQVVTPFFIQTLDLCRSRAADLDPTLRSPTIEPQILDRTERLARPSWRSW